MSEMRRIYVECDGNGVPVRNTYVPDRADRPQNGRQYIHWGEEAENMQSLPANGTNGMLLICLPTAATTTTRNGGFREPRRVQMMQTQPTTTTTLTIVETTRGRSGKNCSTGFVWTEHGKRCKRIDNKCGQ